MPGAHQDNSRPLALPRGFWSSSSPGSHPIQLSITFSNPICHNSPYPETFPLCPWSSSHSSGEYSVSSPPFTNVPFIFLQYNSCLRILLSLNSSQEVVTCCPTALVSLGPVVIYMFSCSSLLIPRPSLLQYEKTILSTAPLYVGISACLPST